MVGPTRQTLLSAGLWATMAGSMATVACSHGGPGGAVDDGGCTPPTTGAPDAGPYGLAALNLTSGRPLLQVSLSTGSLGNCSSLEGAAQCATWSLAVISVSTTTLKVRLSNVQPPNVPGGEYDAVMCTGL